MKLQEGDTVVVGAIVRAAFRSVLSRMGFARSGGSRRVQFVLIGAVGISLSFALTATAEVVADPSAGGTNAKTATTSSALAVRQITVQRLGGRLVGTATIVNTANAAVDSTTGVLALSRGFPGNATGILTFPVPSLAPGSAKKVRLTTRPLRSLPIGSGTYRVVLCTDVYSRLSRFTPSTNCRGAGRLAVSPVSPGRPSGPVPNTIIKAGLASATPSTSAVFRFDSTVPHSTFVCSLDGGPWLACSSPRRYLALADGSHAFAARAISPRGKQDPTPARANWFVDTLPPVVTLTTPVSGSTTNRNTPGFSGTAGTDPEDLSPITVKVFSGSSTSGSPLLTLTAPISGGNWFVATTKALGDGTYTVVAEQSDGAGNVGVSPPSTFTINTSAPPAVSRKLDRRDPDDGDPEALFDRWDGVRLVRDGGAARQRR